MRICYFGTYEKEYPRNRIIIEDLRKMGIEVVECHYPLWERKTDKTGKYLSFFSILGILFRLVWGYLLLFRQFLHLKDFDYLLVGYIGQTDIFVARLFMLLNRKPIIFNPLITIYDTLVIDRGLFKKETFVSKFLFFMDRWALKLSDIVILDTYEHIHYVSDLYGIDQNKFARVFVGADERIFYPREENGKKDSLFHVLFYGKFIPLHGIHYILQSAKELGGEKDIQFQIIGTGQLSSEIKTLAKELDLRNVEFLDWVPYEKLPEYISMSDVCLGIFGDTDKSRRVIPNKVFQALACGAWVITADTPAMRELGEVSTLQYLPSSDRDKLSSVILGMKRQGRGKSAYTGLEEPDLKNLLRVLRVCIVDPPNETVC